MIRRQFLPEPLRRSGSVLIETALVVPVFALFMVGIVEFGHAYLVIGTLNSSAIRAARFGSADAVSTDQVRSRIRQMLSPSFEASKARILIKDGSLFDSQKVDAGNIDYGSLDNIELSEAESRQLFIVLIEVPYDEVALLPPFWAKGARLRGQAVMRRE